MGMRAAVQKCSGLLHGYVESIAGEQNCEICAQRLIVIA